MSVEFFQTRMGRQFYEGTMPEIAKQLARLNDLLERLTEQMKSGAQDSDPGSDAS